MSQLQIIEHNNIRVLTTAQIAEGYGTDAQTITNNFNRNKDRYEKGKHFFCLEGDALQQFKTTNQFDLQFKQAPRIYLWTQRGALLHAKSLNTEKAWQVYDQLVESYFQARQEVKLPKTYLEALEALVDSERSKIALEATNLELAEQNLLMAPKADYFDEIVDRNLLTNIRETAQELHLAEKAFVSFLIGKKYIYRDAKGKLMPYAEKNNGLFELKEYVSDKNGWSGTQTLVTPKGRETFRLLLTKKEKGKDAITR